MRLRRSVKLFDGLHEKRLDTVTRPVIVAGGS